jgi:predicted helicase
MLNTNISLQYRIFPTPASEQENRVICVSDIGYHAPQFSTLMTNVIPDSHLCASLDVHQCFPFYTYDEDGGNRRENITDWGLRQFQAHYGDASIGKWDIFHYVYALLHHPRYRAEYAANLKRELPRVSFAHGDIKALAALGQQLAELHLNDETAPAYPLTRRENPQVPPSYRVEKMKLSKDKTSITINDFLTLEGIPAAAWDYKLGNRSALEWLIDQYQVTTDGRSGITNDPNLYSEDEQYIIKLVGRVARVSVETQALVAQIAAWGW